MKIRHKQSGVVLEGDFGNCEHFGHDGTWSQWFESVRAGHNSRYDKSEWEQVHPHPVWRDVTSEMGATEAECALQDYPNRYRLRKVKLWSQCTPTEPVDAFIVERKECP